ncbi:putative phosphatase regulatory subunit-domain-containing protein [Bombardia bombarda]|uniref:Phosphatase regulatory subunit-domain-containing protein n=1 Tax=Bombardia bombarda TaxID=252184 RepID=A0AA40CBC2_9PEZI|nr:putative phosphatase regulatory subunit-domain-containing protein [Bombardia bombarda]
MPYTPPSHRSPASSAPTSPDASRRPSFHQTQSGNSRPVLPRSASYLTKHRRTPSAPASAPSRAIEPSPETTSEEDVRAMVISTAVRQSPPPITSNREMPKGAVISPPDSSSDDDDLPEIRTEVRGRQIENLKELHDAISQIPQHRSSSPPKQPDEVEPKAVDAGDLLVLPSQASAIAEGMQHSFSTSSLGELAARVPRRISHSRSATEPDFASITKSIGCSLTGSEDDSDEDMLRKPQMVRKKSGELVRPALRPSSQRRPSSMPGTPTFSKMVHFDSHLEHVRHFLQVDRPLAVSAGSSPVDNYDSDKEYPFDAEDRAVNRSPPFEWEIHTSNFPSETPARKALAARLERVWLSPDQKSLIGSVAVANLAFQKFVTCRFTLDYWKTTSEVTAEYMSEIRPGNDRFQFTIKLSDMANLETKTLFFCIRYNVIGQEHWDNNNGTNFQVDFRKKMLPQNGKRAIGAASRPVNGLPKSTRHFSPSTTARPKSIPGDSDEFGKSNLAFDQSIHDYLGESSTSTLRLKGVKSAVNLPSDNLSSRLPAPSGQAFANRYDFGASLTAAIQTAKDTLGKPDVLFMKSSKKPSVPTPTIQSKEPTTAAAAAVVPATTAAATTTPATAKPTTVPGTDSPTASISSSSYEELVNKYCFFGSKQSSPQLKDGSLRSSRFDGADDSSKSTISSTISSNHGSPVQLGNYYHFHNGTQHHSLHPKDPNPYFQHMAPFMSMGVSPLESPLQGFTPQIMGSPLVGQSQTPLTADRSASPVSLVDNFTPLAGTSPNEYPYQPMHDRFPFFGTKAHGATAIRG